jgi:hypothetical protein
VSTALIVVFLVVSVLVDVRPPERLPGAAR